jgi:hypothetical protein
LVLETLDPSPEARPVSQRNFIGIVVGAEPGRAAAQRVDHLDADANASAAYIGYNIHFHTLGKATFTGRYGRPK